MISLFLLSLAAAQEPVRQDPIGCEQDAPVRDPNQCAPLYEEDDFKIYSIESVAVGSIEEMKSIRPKARECGLTNRMDYLGLVDLAVFDIFDATQESRECMISWIETEMPHLRYSKERFDERFREAPLLEAESNESTS